MRISDWSSDVCSSDLPWLARRNARFISCDRLVHRQREADLVQPVQEAMLAEWIDLEMEAILKGRGHHLVFKVDGDFMLSGHLKQPIEIGRAHVCTPVTNAHPVCRLSLAKTK